MKNYTLYFLLLISCLMGMVIGFPLKAWNDRSTTLDSGYPEIEDAFDITDSDPTLELYDSDILPGVK